MINTSQPFHMICYLYVVTYWNGTGTLEVGYVHSSVPTQLGYPPVMNGPCSNVLRSGYEVCRTVPLPLPKHRVPGILVQGLG